jgi:hypothetical protein
MQIHKQVELEKHKKVGNLLQVFRHPTYRRRLLYGFFFFQVLAQMTGVLVINNYQVNPESRGYAVNAYHSFRFCCTQTWVFRGPPLFYFAPASTLGHLIAIGSTR